MSTCYKDDKSITPHPLSQSVTIDAGLTKKKSYPSQVSMKMNLASMCPHAASSGCRKPVMIILLGFNHNNVRGGFTMILSAVAVVSKAMLKGCREGVSRWSGERNLNGKFCAV
jgi:hypothetical protein